MDEFGVYLMSDIVNEIEDCGTQFDFVLAGYTSKLQVLDVGINKPFKDKMRVQFEEFICTPLDDGARRPKITRLMISKWISNAWNGITVESIKNTWNHS